MLPPLRKFPTLGSNREPALPARLCFELAPELHGVQRFELLVLLLLRLPC